MHIAYKLFIINIMGRKSKYIVSQRFGKLTAVRFHHKEKGQHYWLCLCDCGNEKIVRKSVLINSGRPMCDNCRNVIVPNNRSEEKKLYSVWCQMKTRCYNKNSRHYHLYGGKGIEVCDDWLDRFEHFIYAMGERPTGSVLGRIDTEGNFDSINCIWATRSELAHIHRLIS